MKILSLFYLCMFNIIYLHVDKVTVEISFDKRNR